VENQQAWRVENSDLKESLEKKKQSFSAVLLFS
jgi:hypothetical protein